MLVYFLYVPMYVIIIYVYLFIFMCVCLLVNISVNFWFSFISLLFLWKIDKFIHKSCYILSLNYSHFSDLDMYKRQAQQLLKEMYRNATKQSRLSIDTDNFVFHYTIDQGICYLALTDKGYPKRLAFMFLEDVAQEFYKFMKKEHDEGWMQAIETAGRQYAFIRFDREIQKKRGEFADPTSIDNKKKITEDLHSIQSYMRVAIDDVLDRGHKLDDISARSKDLADDSKRMKWGAKKLNTMALLKQWAPLIAIVGVVIIILFLKFYVFRS